ncbi:MAG: hypothetical protein EOO75_02095, partial [Myxococcales bacterium]
MLLRGLTLPGVHAFAREYLGDDAHPVPFVGRADDLAALHAFVASREPFALVTAPAGRGKSALLLRFALDLAARGHRVAWAPISLRFGTHRSATVDELLTSRLRLLSASGGHWRDLLTADDGRPLLLVLDGLDELHDTALLDALTGLALPAGVQVVAAARTLLNRDAGGWAARLGWTGCRLVELAPLSLADLSAALPPGRGVSAQELLARTEGDPLLLRLCMEALDNGEPLPDVADPAELVGAWWSEQRARLQAPDDARATRALAALGAACGVVPWSVLGAVTGDGEAGTRSALAGFARFVVEVPGQGVTFAHPRFAEVARWSLASEVQAALMSYGERVVPARARDEVSPYWLHFGGAHLEAAGAPDQAFAALLTPASVRAWRRHEGDMRGLIDEASALRERALRTLVQSWGGPGVLDAVAHLGLAREATRLLARLDRGVTSALRAALVAHGLRTVESALQAVYAAHDEPYSYDAAAFVPLLPWVTERAVPVLLATATEHPWPRAGVIARLHELGLVSLALGVLLDAPQGMGESLARLAPSLTPGELTRATGAVLAAPAPYLHHLTDRMALWPHLPPDARATLLDDIRARLDDRTLDGHMLEAREALRLVHRLMMERLRQGDLPGALGWLERLDGYLQPLERAGARREFWPPVADVGMSLEAASPALASTFEAMVVRLVALLDRMNLEDWGALLRWRPRADWSSLADQEAARCGWVLLLAWPMPDAWRPRVEAAILEHLRAQLADGSPPEGHGLHLGTLADREGLLALLPAWRASLRGARDGLELARVLAQQGGREGEPRCRALLDELAAEGVPVWEIDGWEQLWPEERRRDLLVRFLRTPPAWGHGDYDLDPLAELANALDGPGEEPAQTRCCERIRSLRPHAHALVVLLARLSPPSDHAGLIAPVLSAPIADTCEIRLIEALVDPALREQVARHFLSHPLSGERLVWPAAVFAALPASGRDAAERAFVARLRADDTPVPLEATSPDWLWQERLDAWVASGHAWHDQADHLEDDPFDGLPSWKPLRLRLRAFLAGRLPDAPDESHLPEPAHPTWRTLRLLLGGLPPDDLARHMLVIDRMARSLRHDLARSVLDLLAPMWPAPLAPAATSAANPEPLAAWLLDHASTPEANPLIRAWASLQRDAGRPADEQLR